MGWLVSLCDGRVLFGAPPRERDEVEFLREEEGVTHYVNMQKDEPFTIKAQSEDEECLRVSHLEVPSDLAARSEAKQIDWFLAAAEEMKHLASADSKCVLYLANTTGRNEEATVAFLTWALLDRATCPRNLGQWLTEHDHALVLDSEDARRMTQFAMDRVLCTNGSTIKSFFKKSK